MKKYKFASIILAAVLLVTSFNFDICVYAEENSNPKDITAEVQPETETESEAGSETESETENVTDNETEPETENGTDAEIEPETESESETESETETESESETETEVPEDEDEVVEVQASPDGVYQEGSFGVVNEDNPVSGSSSRRRARSSVQDPARERIYEGMMDRETSIDLSAYGVSKDNIEALVKGILNDCPELYFVSGTFSLQYHTSNNMVASVYFSYRDGLDDDAFENAVAEAMSLINEDMSDMEKAIAFHEYLVLNCEYDYDNYLNKTIPDNSYSAYGALVEKVAVCQGYALAYKYLCNQVGITCYMVTSDAMNHAWNLIELNGEYYQVDVTWDDPTYDQFGRAVHNYMFVSDATLADDNHNHHDWKVTSGSDVVSYTATDTTYDAYFWTKYRHQIVAVNGAYYYADFESNSYNYRGSIVKYEADTDTVSEIASIGIWNGWDSNSVWQNVYTGVYLIGSRLYYNTKESIGSVSLDGSDQQTEYIVDTVEKDGYIYASVFYMGNVEYLIAQSPNDIRSGTKYTVSMDEFESQDFTSLVTGIRLDQSEMSLKVGEQTALKASITPSYASGVTIEWISSDDTIATVEDGVVTAVAEGVCTITAVAGEKSAQCTVRVVEVLDAPQIQIPEGTYRNRENDITIDKGTLVTLTAKDGTDIYYTTDGKTPVVGGTGTYLYESPIKINKDMTVKAIAVKEWCDDSPVAAAVFKACDNELVLSSEALTIQEGNTASLTVSTLPTLSTSGHVTWEVSDTSLVTWNNGKITAVSGNDGETEITATAYDHKGETVTAVCKVTVLPLEYTVTFKDWDQTVIQSSAVKARRNAELPTDPVRAGYDFIGWEGNAQNINKNETLTAKYEIINYRIDYVLDGGTNDSNNPTTYTIESKKITLKDAGQNKGYFFDGWYSDEQFTEAVTAIPEGSHENLTLYAKWVSIQSEDGFWVEDVDDQMYTGSAIKPLVNVYDGTVLLTQNKDYTLSYKNNIKVNEDFNAKSVATVVVTGKGNYSGRATVNFLILRGDLSEANNNISVENVVLEYSGKAQKPDVALYAGKQKLKKDRDYVLTYLQDGTEMDAVTETGDYEIRITGIGNYTGSRTVALTVTDLTMISKVSAASISNRTYTGEAITPEVVLKIGQTTLVQDVDYDVSYKDNINPGTATAVITGLGKYTGEKRVAFKITGISISKANVANVRESMEYTGSAIKQSGYVLTIERNGSSYTMQEGIDYDVSYKNNIKAGSAYIIFSGIGGYSGTLTKKFTINKVKIENITDTICIDATSASALIDKTTEYTAEYTKDATKPAPTITVDGKTLTEGVDYTVKYKNNSTVGNKAEMVITGKGGFSGTITIPFTISSKNLTSTTSAVTMTAADKVYKNVNGNYLVTPKLTDANGKKLKAGVDYTDPEYTYSKDTVLANGDTRKAGDTVQKTDKLTAGTEVTVKVTGTGNYKGTIATTYRIVEKDIKFATVWVQSQTYRGTAVTLDKSDISVRLGGTFLEESDFEIVGYKNNAKTGIATVTIKGCGSTYGGTKNIKFYIKPAKVSWWWN